MVPIGSMYGIFTYIHHKNQPNVGKYTIHGLYGVYIIPKVMPPLESNCSMHIGLIRRWHKCFSPIWKGFWSVFLGCQIHWTSISKPTSGEKTPGKFAPLKTVCVFLGDLTAQIHQKNLTNSYRFWSVFLAIGPEPIVKECLSPSWAAVKKKTRTF